MVLTLEVGPLAGIRVLELGDTLAAAYAGRLLADLGAEVVKVEPAAGDPLRHIGPFLGAEPHPEASASFAYFHADKRSVVLDGTSDAPAQPAASSRRSTPGATRRWRSSARCTRDCRMVTDSTSTSPARPPRPGSSPRR